MGIWTIDIFPNEDFVQEEGSSSYSPQAKASLLLIFVFYIILEHHHTRSFSYFLWLLFHYNHRVK